MSGKRDRLVISLLSIFLIIFTSASSMIGMEVNENESRLNVQKGDIQGHSNPCTGPICITEIMTGQPSSVQSDWRVFPHGYWVELYHSGSGIVDIRNYSFGFIYPASHRNYGLGLRVPINNDTLIGYMEGPLTESSFLLGGGEYAIIEINYWAETDDDIYYLYLERFVPNIQLFDPSGIAIQTVNLNFYHNYYTTGKSAHPVDSNNSGVVNMCMLSVGTEPHDLHFIGECFGNDSWEYDGVTWPLPPTSPWGVHYWWGVEDDQDDSKWYSDEDGDGVDDENDLCTGYNDNIDVDNDGIPDDCDDDDDNDFCIDAEDPLPIHFSPDIDGDGYGNDCDLDDDGDGLADDQDAFPLDENEQYDSDDDGVGDNADICYGFDDTIDADQDGIPDGCDSFIDYDSDGDGVFSTNDLCPNTAPSSSVDHDGCSPMQADYDEDGVVNALDRCIGGDDRVDEDSDGTPDECDDIIDSDFDGVTDSEDECEGHDDKIDVDGDSTPDGCDDFIDSDHDGYPDATDVCPGYDDLVDQDSDGVPDGCDSIIDSDLDGVRDADDRCDGHDDSIDEDADGNPDGCEMWILTESTQRFVMERFGVSLAILFVFASILSRRLH